MRFTALDVETANADMASICQIGVARFVDGHVVEEWSTLVDPQEHFSAGNVRVHGIGQEDVRGWPTFPQIVGKLDGFLRNEVCVCHTHFDRVAIGKAFEKYGLEPISLVWLDSAMVTRKTWADCAQRGYGLADVTKKIGYKFKHHDALEDAKACGYVLVAATKVSGVDVDGWVKRLGKPNGGGRKQARPAPAQRVSERRVEVVPAQKVRGGEREVRPTSFLERLLQALGMR